MAFVSDLQQNGSSPEGRGIHVLWADRLIRVIRASDWSTRWLAITAIGLALIHLVLVSKHQSAGQLGINLVCYGAVVALLRRRPEPLLARSGPLPTLLGTALVWLTLSNSLFYQSRDGFLYLAPLMGAVGLALLTHGFAGFRRFRGELLILFFLGVPRGFVSGMIDLAPLTAQASGFLLWYAGYNVKLEGVDLILPGGSVTVGPDCDGMGAMTYVISLAVVFMVVFPVRRAQAVLILLVAVGSAFFINTLRVSVLAVIQASGHPHAFDFWHQGQGSGIWTVLPVAVLGAFCLRMVRRPAGPPAPSGHTIGP